MKQSRRSEQFASNRQGRGWRHRQTASAVRNNSREVTMLKQILFIITVGVVAAAVTGSAHATPIKDIALPEMVDEAGAGRDLPADR
jgi:hypothetical protein